MASFTVTTNSAEVKKRMIQREKIAEKEILRLIQRGVGRVESTVIIGLHGGPKSGATYTRRSVTHTASAAGEYPATDTGFLASNISSSLDRKRKIGRVTSSANYSKHLEYGTKDMAARPFMFPSLEKNRKKILGWFKDAGLLRRTR